MGESNKGLSGSAVVVPPLGGTGGGLSVPPLGVDLSGSVGSLLDLVSPLGSIGGGGSLSDIVSPLGSMSGGMGSLSDGVPPLGAVPEGGGSFLDSGVSMGDQPAGQQSGPPPLSTASASAGTSVYPAPGYTPPPLQAGRAGSSIASAPMPKDLAVAKPLDRSTRDLAAPKAVEMNAEEVTAPKAVDRRIEDLAAAKGLDRSTRHLAAPKAVVRHAEALEEPEPAVRHRDRSLEHAPHHGRHRGRGDSAESEPSEVDVLLIAIGDEKPDVVQVVKRLLQCKSKQAKRIMKRAPVKLMKGVSYREGRAAVDRLKDAGADAELDWENMPVAATADVVLHEIGPRKISVIKIVRDLTGLGLSQAKQLVDAAPVRVAKGVSIPHAREIVRQLREVGATVEAME